MTILRAVVRLQQDTLNPLDTSVNVLHFFTLGDPATIAAEIADDIETAYEAFEGRFANAVAADFGTSVTFYDLSDPEPRAPVYQDLFPGTFTPAGGQMLPNEVAMCLSFQAARVSGQPQARRRGRIFLGPLGQVCLDSTDTGRPSIATIVAAVNVGTSLLSQSVASLNYDWVVFSRADNEGYPVVDGWVDNAWDTQRRRGLAPTTRTIFT
jgi:hypothetical protein